MNLKIIKIGDRGKPNQERLWLEVLVDVNLSNYIVVKTNYTSGEKVKPRSNLSYWFPVKHVKAGDNIILYSGNGTETTNVRKDGKVNHFFFWNLNHTIWNTIDDCAILFELNGWGSTNRGN